MPVRVGSIVANAKYPATRTDAQFQGAGHRVSLSAVREKMTALKRRDHDSCEVPHGECGRFQIAATEKARREQFAAYETRVRAGALVHKANEGRRRANGDVPVRLCA